MVIKLITSFIPQIVGFIIPTVKKLAEKETPKVGEKLADAGAKLFMGGGALLGGATSITLPEAPDSWLLVIQNLTALIGAVTSLIGAIMVLVGKTQTTDNPDSDRNL
jgi:hypothetical protein